MAAIRVAILMACASVVAVAHAHHSRSAYDDTKMLEIRGTVVDFNFRSPHAPFVVDGIAIIGGERQSDQAERWEFESEAVPVLRTQGIEADTFQPGDAIVLRGNPHRTEGFRFAHATEFVSVNGRPLANRPSERAQAIATASSQGGVAAASGESGLRGIAGRWMPVFVPPGNGSPLPLNGAGLAAWRNYDPKRSPANTCEPMSIPEIFHAPFYLFEIRLDNNEAVLYTEAYQIRRTVPLDGTQAPADPEGPFGMVNGRVEDGALVIESSGYPPSRWGLGAATQLNGGGADVPSSAEKTVLERYSATPGGRKLVYEYTLTDPVYLTEPYRYRIEFIRMPDDTPIYSYECDVESASMFSRTPDDPPLRVGD